MRVWQRVFGGAADPAFYNIRGAISASPDGSGGENRGWRQGKWVTRPTDASLGLPAPPEGHRGSGPRRRESANPRPSIAKSACDQTTWDAHARMGPRTSDSGRSRRDGHMDPRTGGWGTAMPGRPGPGVKPPARRRGKSRDSRMLDWDAPARLGRSGSIGTLRLDWDAPARLGRPGSIDSAPCPASCQSSTRSIPAAKSALRRGGITQPTAANGLMALSSAIASGSSGWARPRAWERPSIRRRTGHGVCIIHIAPSTLSQKRNGRIANALCNRHSPGPGKCLRSHRA